MRPAFAAALILAAATTAIAEPDLETAAAARRSYLLAVRADNAQAPASADSPTQPEAAPPEKETGHSITQWLIAAAIFTACILLAAPALRKHQCCCGKTKKL